MLKKLINKSNNNILIKVVYFDQSMPDFICKKNATLTEDLTNNIAYFYIDKENLNIDKLKSNIDKLILQQRRNFTIDVASFTRKEFNTEIILQLLISRIEFLKAKLFAKHQKHEEKNEQKIIYLFLENADDYQELVNKFIIVAQAVNQARNLQIKPENYCNSEMLAEEIVKDFHNIENLSVKILTKAQIKELNMGLLLSVNKGSTHEPRVVVIEYTGNPESTQKYAYVGKGITFDTGGVNTKGYHMSGMKYDMSGSVIVAYAVKALAQLKAKTNVSAIMMITDNRLDGDASLPENIYESMSGKWVEVTDTDAEGRLVLADGLYYAAKELKSNVLVDVATLTGSLSYALGSVYSGIWATDDDLYEQFAAAANTAQEKVWRMPMHEDYNKTNKETKVADLNNYSKNSLCDSNSAAMFLKEFTNDVPYIHCDVAFTADIKGEPQGALIATLVDFALLQKEKKC